MKKLFTLIFILSILLGACTPAETPTAEPIEEVAPTEAPPEPTEEPEPTAEPEPEVMIFVDDLGNSFGFIEYPQAIISISPSTTEILFALGAGEQVVGRDDASLFPEEVLDVPSVGALWGDLPTETILALEPDIILAAEIISEEQVQALKDLGLNVYWQANPDNYEELWDNLREIAALTGHEDEAETLIVDLDARVKTVQEIIAPIDEIPTVFYELDATDPASPWTTGGGTFIDYIITEAGGANVAVELAGEYAQISSEELLATNPDVILLADALYGVTAESVGARPGWDVIAAVKNGAIYAIDPNIMSVPGPRLVDGLEETAKLLHPEAFE
ncbi:MAG TPA: hypothetical protein EYP74_04350 [Anaerolineales bacterium]|nr:hypothetical protein [Anaerolineales bacterium]